ncbi:MAG: LPS export ABC transporter periplasmic protein LptC [Candidatus Cloacimonetes bacterium 4572_65]|nr:MAG: LPS export ABC transporter periplasmic protein LptC [Candidatus Cloacimonetes bacterium 4572_65]
MKKLLQSFIFSILLLLLVGCETTTPDTGSGFDDTLPDEYSKNVELNRYSGDKLEYSLKARSIIRYYDQQRTIADSVFLKSIDEESGILSTLKCDTTIINDASNLITGKGNVVIKYGDIRRIETELILWDRSSGRIKCPGEVDMWDEDRYLRGTNLITNTKLEMTKLENVSGEGVADEKAFSDITNINKSAPTNK